ncbi:MAG: Ig-like domain-containing protein [Clostridia bacterium]|nr:Ig-like domain-containing protein [Clostridia bacterium]
MLLILAGTSIAMLTGENGIISQAQNAKNNSAKAEFEEKVKLAVTASRINEDGTRIDLSKLDGELKNNAKIPAENIDKSGDNEGLPWIVTEKDYMYLITEDGRVVEIKGIALDKSQLKLLKNESKTLRVIKSKDVNGDVTWSTENAAVAIVDNQGNVTAVGEVGQTTKITARVEGTNYSATCTVIITDNVIEVTPEEIAANPKDYYGQVVKNYTAGGATYRIFFVDTANKYEDGKNTVYLKADHDQNIRAGLMDYANYISEKTKVRKMNPSWSANRGDNESIWNYNEKAAAWLCDPEDGNNINRPWSNCYDGSKASYVIAGPSAEMYVDSYNSVPHTIGNNTLRAIYSVSSYPGYMYKINNESASYSTNIDTIDYEDYGSMYAGKDGAKGPYYWWLVSPSSYNSNSVWYVHGLGAYLQSSKVNFSDSEDVITPLVSLKSDFTIQIEK